MVSNTMIWVYMEVDQFVDPIGRRVLLVFGGCDFYLIIEVIVGLVECKMFKGWWFVFLISFGMLIIYGISIRYLVWEGIGVWGLNNFVVWGWVIVNFVFWIGIGHVGMLILVIFFLFW